MKTQLCYKYFTVFCLMLGGVLLTYKVFNSSAGRAVASSNVAAPSSAVSTEEPSQQQVQIPFQAKQ